MPTIPSRRSLLSSREASELSIPNDLYSVGPRAEFSRRETKFNPALIPLLPISTLTATPPDLFVSTRHSLEGRSDGPNTGTILDRRQQASAYQQTSGFIPLSYKNLDSGPKPGVIVGIVLGAVAGAIFVYWLFTFVLIQAPRTGLIEGDEQQDVIIERHHRSSGKGSRSHKKRRRRKSHHSRTRSRSVEMSEHRRERKASPAPSRRRSERIIVTETRTTGRTQQAPPPPEDTATSPDVDRRTTVTEERSTRRVQGDDEVEVLEEHSEISERPPRPSSKRPSGFRPVDPSEYGGGNYAQREVYTSRRASRSNR